MSQHPVSIKTASSATAPPVVMLAVDEPDLRNSLREHLADVYDVQDFHEMDDDLGNLAAQMPAVFILDNPQTASMGEPVVTHLRTDPLTAHIPVIQALTEPWQSTRTGEGSTLDPDGFLYQPFVGQQVRITVDSFLELAKLRQDTVSQKQEKIEQQHILDNFNESFIAVDASWRITHINAAAEGYVGADRMEVMGTDIWQTFTVDADRAKVYRRAMEERVPVKLEGSSPEYGWFQVDAVPFDDGGLGVYFRSATQLKEAEAAAFASERWLRLFLEHAEDYALALLDPAGCVLEWLGGGEAITGWSAEDMLGQSLKVLFTPEDLAKGEFNREFERAAKDGRAADTRWHQKKDGSRFFADGVTTAFQDEAGKLQGFGKVFRDATSEKLAEEAIRESQAQLQLVLSSVADGIYTMTSDASCEFFNPAGAAMLGYQPEELVGQPIHDLIHHHRADGSRYPIEECKVTQAFHNGAMVQVDDEVFWHKNGKPVPVHYSINPMVTDGQITGAVVAFTDVTERKRAEQVLQESERRLRFVMDSIPQKIFTATAEGDVNYLNPAWTEFTGFSVDEFQNQNWSQLIHPDDLEENTQVWEDAVDTGESFQFEHRIRNAEGRYRWHLSRAEPMRNEEGQIVMWVGSNTDIHDIKTAEFKLARKLASEQHNAALLADIASASQAINAVLSVDGIAEILAERATTILGVRQAVVSIKSRTALINTASSTGTEETLDFSPLCAQVCRANRALRLTREELEQHVDWREDESSPGINGWLAVPLIGHGGKNIGLVYVSGKLEGAFTIEDEAILTQLAAIAAVGIENASLYDSLREQDRRKDEFLATLAHELRNPLAPLRTGLDIMQLSGGDRPTATVRDMMERQLSHLVRLVDDLMDVSRVNRGKVELRRARVSVQAILEAALETTSPLIHASKHRLEVDLPDEHLYVYGDLTRLAQIVSNLLNNAAKYTPEGGTVAISAGRDKHQAKIRVTDTGIGLSEEMLPKVFDLFAQASPTPGLSHGGLGIGLALVQQLVGMHGGTIAAESRGIDKGSSFTVTIPLSEPAPSQAVADESKVEAKIAEKRILIVDDNVDAAKTLAMLLELGGHRVAVSHSGVEAISTAREHLPHLIFLDLGLPDMHGHQVAAALRQEPGVNDVIIVALTGWGSEDDRRRSEEAGFDLHLSKPVDAKSIGTALERFFPSPCP